MRVGGKTIKGTAAEHAEAYDETLAPGVRFRAADISEWATDKKLCGVDQAVRFADRVLIAGKKARLWRFSGRFNRWVAS